MKKNATKRNVKTVKKIERKFINLGFLNKIKYVYVLF